MTHPSISTLLRSLLMTALIALPLTGCETRKEAAQPSATIHHPQRLKGQVLDQWGVEVLGLSSTAAGYMLDLRYRVLDPAKAQPLADSRSEAYVLDPASNTTQAVADTPTAGKLRERGRPLMADRVYSIVFANPGKQIGPGAKVNLVVGDLHLNDVTVQ